MFPIIAGVMLLVASADTPKVTRSPGTKASEVRKVVIDKVETKRQEFRDKLAEIRDGRKQKILENLDTRIVSVNTKWVNNWNNVLTRLSGILAKIELRSDDAGVQAQVDEAKVAIELAQNAVNEQAGKTYVFEIGEEETLGDNASETLSVFHADLRKVHALVKEARSETVDALRLLKGLSEGKEREKNEE